MTNLLLNVIIIITMRFFFFCSEQRRSNVTLQRACSRIRRIFSKYCNSIDLFIFWLVSGHIKTAVLNYSVLIYFIFRVMFCFVIFHSIFFFFLYTCRVLFSLVTELQSFFVRYNIIIIVFLLGFFFFFWRGEVFINVNYFHPLGSRALKHFKI